MVLAGKRVEEGGVEVARRPGANGEARAPRFQLQAGGLLPRCGGFGFDGAGREWRAQRCTAARARIEERVDACTASLAGLIYACSRAFGR